MTKTWPVPSYFTLLFIASIVAVGSEVAYVKSFTAAGNRATWVNLNSVISLSCVTSGDPLPTATLFKAPLRDGNMRGQLQEAKGSVTLSFRASCSNIGLYQCQAINRVKDRVETSTKSLIVRAMCPPTRCRNVKPIVNMDAVIGYSRLVWLCIAAYPIPDVDKFRVQKAVDGTWRFADAQKPSIELGIQENMMILMKLTYPEITESDLGFYRLLYKEDLTTMDRGVPLLEFELARRTHMAWMGGEESMGVPGVALLTGLVVVACMAAMVVSVVVSRRCLKVSGTDALQQQPQQPQQQQQLLLQQAQDTSGPVSTRAEQSKHPKQRPRSEDVATVGSEVDPVHVGFRPGRPTIFHPAAHL